MGNYEGVINQGCRNKKRDDRVCWKGARSDNAR